MQLRFAILALLAWTMLSGCNPAPRVQFHNADAYPDKLSAWGLLKLSDNDLQIASSSAVYALNTPLFSDYALKLRTIYIPPNSSAKYADFEAFDLPTGSIIAKTFLYQTNNQGELVLDAKWDGNPASLDHQHTQLIETRLLVKQTHGWDALPYVWRDDDAYLSITGDLLSLPTEAGSPLNYLVPSRNQCASCHATDHTAGDLLPIGIKARHLHRADPVHEKNQLLTWQQNNQLEGVPNLDTIDKNVHWRNESAPIAHQARSYLDINCGHCHNPKGPADTSGLMLDYQSYSPAKLGVCKPPIAAGRGSGGHLYGIVPGVAAASILSFRMSTTDPGTMMPELGRSLVDQQGLKVVSQWIDSMQGECL